MTNCGFGNWTAPHPLLKQENNMKEIKLATTSFRDKTLFKPTASASTGSGGPCNEHRQKAKACGLNYEILMFHCFTLTIAAATHSNALCFSDTQWQQLRQWWLLTAWKDLVQTLHLPRQSLQKVATPDGSHSGSPGKSLTKLLPNTQNPRVLRQIMLNLASTYHGHS